MSFFDKLSVGENVSVGIETPIADILAAHTGIRLDIGCGANKQPGFVGIDLRPLDGVDIVWDVTKYPWPLPDESVNIAIASHLVEHIPPHNFTFVNFMNEVWRIMRPEAEFAIVCPHGSSQGYIQDPTHCNPINETTWAYFDPWHPSRLWTIYQPRPWKIKYLSWSPAANIEVALIRKRVEDIEAAE